MSKRPPGGTEFEAVRIAPEGWVVLAPWVTNPDGYWFRPHVAGAEGWSRGAEEWARHIADQINAAMRGGR